MAPAAILAVRGHPGEMPNNRSTRPKCPAPVTRIYTLTNREQVGAMSNNEHFRVVEAGSLKMEEGAEDLMSAPEIEPYLRYIEASMSGADVQGALQGIAALPLEKRYVWRVASALKWGFADFESWNVVADKETLKPQDAAKLLALLRSRPIQFCMFLKALVGPDEMERLMQQGIAIAKTEL